MFHFTSFTSNLKEGNETPNPKQVNIGPHYLALSSGRPADSNNDGVADFLADRNGNGVEDSDEMPWTSANNGTLAILAPANNSTVSGVVSVYVDLGANASSIESIYALVDGRSPLGTRAPKKPAESIAQVEINTRYLNNGQHSLVIGYVFQGPAGRETGFSTAMNISTLNDIRQPSPEQKAGEFITIEMEVPASLPNYTIWFFDLGYPISRDPAPIYSSQGTSAGTINYSETPANLGYGDGSVDPRIYSITELYGGGQAAAVPNATIFQLSRWRADVGPSTGWWAATYSDDPIEYGFGGRVADKYSYNINPLTWAWNDLWYHGVWLNSGWRLCGALSSSGSQPTIVIDPSPMGLAAQTWPVRLWSGERFPSGSPGPQPQDLLLLLSILKDPNVRNFYGLGHGLPGEFLQIDTGVYESVINHRYRFVFLDGCNTGADRDLFSAFGATGTEFNQPQFPHSDVQAPIDINYYNITGFRPSAFLGWKSTPVVGIADFAAGQTQDDLTGKPDCWTVCYPALANWHSQFLFNWVFGRTLLQAIEEANYWAFSPSSDPAPRFDGFTLVKVPKPDGTTVQENFRPENHLRVYGYGDLKFNEYNHAADWPR